MQIKIKYLASLFCSLVLATSAFGQTNPTTTVLFSTKAMTGQPLHRKIMIVPVNPYIFNGADMFVGAPIPLEVDTNGLAQTNLIPNSYVWSIEGIAKLWSMNVFASDVVQNAGSLSGLPGYLSTNPPSATIDLSAFLPQTNGTAVNLTIASALYTNGNPLVDIYGSLFYSTGIPLAQIIGNGIATLNWPDGGTFLDQSGNIYDDMGYVLIDNADNIHANSLRVVGAITNGNCVWFTATNTTAPNGSIYTTTTGQFYVRSNNVWVAK